MGKAEREAAWEQERAVRWRAAILTQSARPGGWAVVKVNDDGREEEMRRGTDALGAERIAGQLRDRCPDSDVEAGWNYLARYVGRTETGAPGGRVQPMNRSPGQVAGARRPVAAANGGGLKRPEHLPGGERLAPSQRNAQLGTAPLGALTTSSRKLRHSRI